MATKKRKSNKDFYLKFYFNDFSIDPKLRKCSASSAGVYIYLMCLFCNEPPRGKYQLDPESVADFAEILPQQNVQQSNQQIVRQIPSICRNISAQFSSQLPYNEKVICDALTELLTRDVLYLEGSSLCQKRMIRDAEISAIRASSGKKGAAETNKKNKTGEPGAGKKPGFAEILPQQNNQQNSQQKHQQNPNYNSDYDYNSLEVKGVSNNMGGGVGENFAGGEEDLSQNNLEGNWHFSIPVNLCKNFFFTHQAFGRAKDGAIRVLSDYFWAEPAAMEERLSLWADEFNELLERTGDKGANGQAIKAMQGRDSWPNHFHNWLLSQKSRLKELPDRRQGGEDAKNQDGTGVNFSELSGDVKKQEEFYKRKL